MSNGSNPSNSRVLNRFRTFKTWFDTSTTVFWYIRHISESRISRDDSTEAAHLTGARQLGVRHPEKRFCASLVCAPVRCADRSFRRVRQLDVRASRNLRFWCHNVSKTSSFPSDWMFVWVSGTIPMNQQQKVCILYHFHQHYRGNRCVPPRRAPVRCARQFGVRWRTLQKPQMRQFGVRAS